MKTRPAGFLSDKEIAHNSETFDYIRELHDYLWRFIRATLGPGAGITINACIDKAVEKAERRQAIAHAIHALRVIGFSTSKARSIVQGGNSLAVPLEVCLFRDCPLCEKEGEVEDV